VEAHTPMEGGIQNLNEPVKTVSILAARVSKKLKRGTVLPLWEEGEFNSDGPGERRDPTVPIARGFPLGGRREEGPKGNDCHKWKGGPPALYYWPEGKAVCMVNTPPFQKRKGQEKGLSAKFWGEKRAIVCEEKKKTRGTPSGRAEKRL